jgi:hypothetical protein
VNQRWRCYGHSRELPPEINCTALLNVTAAATKNSFNKKREEKEKKSSMSITEQYQIDKRRRWQQQFAAKSLAHKRQARTARLCEGGGEQACKHTQDICSISSAC